MFKPICLLSLFLLVGSLMPGQTRGGKPPFLSAEELRRNYRFEEAVKIYKEIYDSSRDNSLKGKSLRAIALCENGLSMLAYSTNPSVKASFIVPFKEFFLYYPDMPDSTWSLVPLFLNRHKRDYPVHNVMHFDPYSDTQYFSAQDSSGRWDIYCITRIDSLRWSFPEPLDSVINSPGNELFPVLSRDRKKLYFSSDGHYGIGGFDLFVSVRNESTGRWGQPENLGFPLSSTGNDLLYIDTQSGKYSVLASDRDISSGEGINMEKSIRDINLQKDFTHGDSIKIYVLDYENLPVKRAISTPEEAAWVARLTPFGKDKKESFLPSEKGAEFSSREIKDTAAREIKDTTGGFLSNNIESGYSKMMREARKIQSEIDSTQHQINKNRELLISLTNNDDRALLEKRIFEAEFQLIEQQSRLRSVKQMVQEQEMEFLTKGIIIPRDFFDQEQPQQKSHPDDESLMEIVPKISSYGSLPEIGIVEPDPIPDLTFRTGGESVIMENLPLPEGLVYTVQLFMLSDKTDASTFKGLYPVFEEGTASGKYVYTVGRFSTYSELSAAYNKIRALRFSNAVSKAYLKGKPLSIREARVLEDKLLKEQSYQVVLTGFPGGLPQPVIEIIRQNTDKDVAIKVIDGKNVYFIGPYTTRAEAEKLTGLLSSVSENVTIETIKK